jgi:hypothetical protein
MSPGEAGGADPEDPALRENAHAAGETAQVEIDGRTHPLTVQVNPETRKAAVRLDGRMALPPFPADDQPRPLTLAGHAATIDVSADGSFRLSVGGPSPPGQRARAPAGAAPATSDHNQRNLMIGVAVMMAAMALPALISKSRQRAARPKPISWTSFSSAQGGYVADFPSAPTETEKTNPLPNGGTERDFLAEANLGEKGDYAVVYVDLGELGRAITTREMMRVTELVQSRVHGTPQTTATCEPAAWCGIIPCVESRADLPNRGKLIVRAWMDRTRQSTALAAYPADGEADARRFIDSVQPLGGPRRN